MSVIRAINRQSSPNDRLDDLTDGGSSDFWAEALARGQVSASSGSPSNAAGASNTTTLSVTQSQDEATYFAPSSTGDAAGSITSGPASTTLYLSPSIQAGLANDISVVQQSYVSRAGGQYNLGQMFTVSAVNGVMPSQLMLTLYDRDNYAGNQTYSYGTLVGTDGERDSASGYTLVFSLVNGKYVTASGMQLCDYTFVTSSQQNRLQNVSLSAYSNGAWVGTRNVDITTNTTYVDATPGSATAAEIATVAKSFIGQTWNNNGCWVLASDIAACAGVSLTINSGFVMPAYQGANGQMSVAYNASKGVQAGWASTLQAGDMVEVAWLPQYGGGHIFTIDRVTSGQAYLVDNSGARPGGDNVTTDVTVAEQSVSSYLPFIDQTSVVVFRDTGTAPAPTSLTATTLANPFTDVVVGKSVAGSSLFTSTDPGGKTITQYMVRNDGTSGYFSVAGKAQANGTWITVSSAQLAQLTYTAGATSATSDTFEAKAYDGSWGVASIGRLVSLSSLSGQTVGTVGAVVSGQSKTVTDWIPSGTESWTFTIGASSGAVGLSLANTVGTLNLSVYNSAGRSLGSFTKSAFTGPMLVTGSLAAGTYTATITDVSGASNYDLTIGSLATVQAQAQTQSLAYTPPASSTGASAPSVTGTIQTGSAASLAWADSSGLGTGGAESGLIAQGNQDDKSMLALVKI